MSFRIEDILKESTPKDPVIASDKNSVRNECSTNFKSNSILEYTLNYKSYHQEQNLRQDFYNKYSVNYDHFNRNISDSFLSKYTNARYLYARENMWSNYVPYPVMFNCSHIHSRRKGGQIRFTSSQTEELEKQFNSHQYLSPEDRKQLADLLRLSDRQVKTWFQNRRAKWRRNNQTCTSRNNDISLNNIHEKYPEVKNKLNYL